MKNIIKFFRKNKKEDATSETDRMKKNLVTFNAPHSFEAEQYNMLMTNLINNKNGETPQVIMVTSTDTNEGKSLTATNLAISIAKNTEKKVLLIDCDLRLPTIHKYFGFDNEPGLSEFLSGNIKLAPLLKKYELDRLTILPAGATPENPLELLSSSKMTRLVNYLKKRYNDIVIILDTAPPQITSESNSIAQLADGIILVVNHGSTRMEAVNELVDLLGREKLLGVIMNRFKSRLRKTYGYNKHQKYYRKVG